ncbi:sigma-54-dependent Fis family transcriptional regulator [Proteobacteria bacterium 005FR1]|nr:sigma-54-dependent Fis family transcriptional regulator [Proteobacteria bacterium 005FR1]
MAQGPTALFVDANLESRIALMSRLERGGIRVVRSASVHEASHLMDELIPALAVIALDLPDGDAMDLLNHPALEGTREIILIGDDIEPERARQAFLAGASCVFSNPLKPSLIESFFEDLAEDLRSGAAPPGNALGISQLGSLYGNTTAMDKLFRKLRKVAETDAHVLLCGESGTGKTLAALTIHQLSSRSDGPFVSFHCGAIPSIRVEASLFGTADGSKEPGCLQRAFGGTLLLEDVTELPRDLQLRLLQVLERDGAGPGERMSIPEVRIIGTTNHQPDDVLKSGCLREDLYFRIASAQVSIPPLRAHTEDIDGLATVFLREFNERAGTEKSLSRDTLAILKSYGWPGNVRELRSVLEQAFTMAEQQISPEHLPDFHGQPVSDGEFLQLTIGDSVQEAEKKLTLATLAYYQGDKRKAAHTLGVSLKTLYNRINAYRAEQRTPLAPQELVHSEVAAQGLGGQPIGE